ncbi:MAG: tripartite tricarboxylate transporter TctB family protein [Betaproteobacteria bacterium]|nr:tripartite tricarboxylate transporter TctB family protein [Betaproteobacteria bacterium]
MDMVTAAVIFAVGAVVVWDSMRLGAKWGSDGPEAGYFPFYIGLILCVSSIVNFIGAWMRRQHRSFVGVNAFKAILSVMLPTIAYVALIGGVGPLPKLGIYVASALFIALFMKWLGKYGWGKTIGVSIAVPAAFFVLFEIWFKVPLPKGPLEAAIGFA